jgi:hypothetical protein
MTALAADRSTLQKPGEAFVLPVAAAVTIYAGSLVAINAAGNAQPGATATGLKVVGRAEEQVNNSFGAAGDLTVTVRRGVFKFENDTSDPVTVATLLEDCYIVDDQTVAATSGSSTRSRAGQVIQVDPDGVWVDTSK